MPFFVPEKTPSGLKLSITPCWGNYGKIVAIWKMKIPCCPVGNFTAHEQTAALLSLPEGVLVLTCGVDTQDDRLEYEVVGHGYYGETWGIKKA